MQVLGMVNPESSLQGKREAQLVLRLLRRLDITGVNPWRFMFL